METVKPSAAARYRELVMRHRTLLRWLCLRRALGDPDVADDYFQEISLTLWRYLGNISPDASPKQERAYVRQAALYALGHCRRDGKADLYRLEADLAVALDESGREHEQFLDDLVAALPSEEDRLVAGLYRSGYTASDIALYLGISPNAASQRIHRLGERLRDIYQKEMQTLKHLSNGK